MIRKTKQDFAGFFAVIPAPILLSKDIAPNAKLLFGVIASLCQKEGYCWASNTTIGGLVGLQTDTVSDLIQALKNLAFIDVEWVPEEQKRRIWLGTGMLPKRPGVECERTRGRVRTDSGSSTNGRMDIYDDNTIYETKDKETSTSSAEQADHPVLPVLDFKKRYPTESLPFQLADLLITLVVNRRPGEWKKFRVSQEGQYLLTQRHAKHFDLLLERDLRPVEEVLEVLQWSQKDHFWKDNIRSGEKFRRQYEILLSQMKEQGVGSQRPDPNPELTKELIGTYRGLIANPGFNPSPVQHTKFIIGAERMVAFFNQYQEVDRCAWCDYLMECLERQYTEHSKEVYPGHFCSDHTWEVLMPQYLLDAGLVVWKEQEEPAF